MGSLRLVYDAEGDILDVDFRLTGEKQGLPLYATYVGNSVVFWMTSSPLKKKMNR